MTAMASEVRERGSAATRRLWVLLAIFVAGSVALSAIADWRVHHLFLINATQSLPNWAFLIQRGVAPARGDYIFFDPPRSPLLRRHFGDRPQMFGKIVYGMPGDVITHDGPIVRVDGRDVARMKARTRLGERLSPGKTGVIPGGCYYVGTAHKDGFDSRYAEIGLVCQRQIIGVGTPVL